MFHQLKRVLMFWYMCRDYCIYIYIYTYISNLSLCQSKSCQRQMHHIYVFQQGPSGWLGKTTVSRGVDSWYCGIHWVEWLKYCDCKLVERSQGTGCSKTHCFWMKRCDLEFVQSQNLQKSLVGKKNPLPTQPKPNCFISSVTNPPTQINKTYEPLHASCTNYFLTFGLTRTLSSYSSYSLYPGGAR